ncbi:MAG TPA: hypothetical protein VJ997_15160 [Longimicrobiales bacterium]|nr:hypothetical protein [Longimicrobiales bacterium]
MSATPRRILAVASAAAAVFAVAPLGAQVRLERPRVAFAEDFGSIQTVRELPDGRVLVADPLGKALYVLDPASGTRTVVGSEGQGPREYLQPDAVWPLPGDSTLLVDLGNGRVVALGPDLGFGPTMPIGLSEPGPGRTLVLALPQGVDGRGRIYIRALGGMGGGALPDSAAILRVDRGTRAADTVANMKLPDRTQATSGGANNRNVQISNVPLSPEDAWGVSADGFLAIARAGDYHIDWISPDGRVTRGAPVPYDPVRIGTDEKEQWVAEQGRSGGGIGIGLEIQNGVATMSFARGGAGDRRAIDGYTWPDRMPAFYGGRLPMDGQGRAWVRRALEAGAPSTYDVFDRSGRRVGTVTLDAGKRVLGFGKGVVYVVAFDDFDLNYLEVYALPPL